MPSLASPLQGNRARKDSGFISFSTLERLDANHSGLVQHHFSDDWKVEAPCLRLQASLPRRPNMPFCSEGLLHSDWLASGIVTQKIKRKMSLVRLVLRHECQQIIWQSGKSHGDYKRHWHQH